MKQTPPDKPDEVTVLVKDGDLVENEVSGPAWAQLMANMSDPIEQLAGALHFEVMDHRLSLDVAGKRLVRASGRCNFCKNERWTLPGGCAYPSAQGEVEPAAGPSLFASSEGSAQNNLTPPDAVRLWRGVRRAGLSADDFDKEMRRVFVPATIAMMAPKGLTAYQPLRLPEKPEYNDIAEVALVAYRTAATYDEARQSTEGRAYGALHQTCFDFDKQDSRRLSRSAFAKSWPGVSIADSTPYSLLDAPVDLQAGQTEVLIGQLHPDHHAAMVEYLTALAAAPPPLLRAYFFVRDANLFMRWAVTDGGPPLPEPLDAILMRANHATWQFPSSEDARVASPFAEGVNVNVLF